MKRLLAQLGLDRPELRAWALYDWANSAFVTTIVAAVFPIFFETVAGEGLAPTVATQRFAFTTTLAKIVIALGAPLLGAIADCAPIKKKLLASFMALGVLTTAMMVFIDRGEWLFAALLFLLATIGANGSFVFYDALLPHIATDREIDRVSSAGYALGYFGGGILLAVNLLWIQKPAWFGLPDGQAAVRLSFLSVAVWWTAFAIPLFRRVPEPPLSLEEGETQGSSPWRLAIGRLGGTLRDLRAFDQAFLMLLAFIVYNDGVGTIISLAAIYGVGIGIPQSALIGALLITQFVGIPFTFLFGAIAGRIGAKRAILASLAVYAVVSVFAYFMTTALHFYMLAILVGMVQGGSQALGRSLFATLIPAHRSSEFFAFLSVFEKFAGISGPLLFGLALQVTGSSRYAILSVIVFFIAGAALLAFVDVPRGQAAARAAEEAARGAA